MEYVILSSVYLGVGILTAGFMSKSEVGKQLPNGLIGISALAWPVLWCIFLVLGWYYLVEELGGAIRKVTERPR